jgi:cyclophilin family peptidyl-prolyl cis-trans isomerase/HEAT repeat protein
MSRVATVAGVLCLLAACPSRHVDPVTPPPPVDDKPLRVSVARAEVRRDEGVRELQELLRTGDHHAKLLALRGLGRIGGPTARAVLIAALQDKDAELIAGAMSAIGLARELDELTIEEGDKYVGVLHNAFARTTGAGRLLAIEALGRAGDQRSQPLLAAELRGAPEVAEAAGVALARQGRRKIALAPATIKALIDAMNSPEPRARYGAVYAFARAQPLTKPDPALSPALAARVGDTSADVRAQAIVALAKHNFVGATTFQLEHGLVDKDWRVAVEAVRAMTGDKALPEHADAVAVALVRRLADLDSSPTEAHVILEGLRGLQKHSGRALVNKAMSEIATWASISTKTPELTRGWIACLATAGVARAANTLAGVGECAQRRLPDHLRLPLVADLLGASIGSAQDRRVAIAQLLAHSDVRVRASVLAQLTAGWKTMPDADRRAAVGILVGAIASPDPIMAGSAIDAATKFYEAMGKDDHAAIDVALVARAASEKEPELAATVFDVIAEQKIAAGVDACRAGLTGAPVRARAARACLSALGEPTTDMLAPVRAPAPPVDVAGVIGAQLEWHVITTRGEIVIELRPDVAPWAVASIVALTEQGKYDGLELHRVVPNFVVQGGDPTESGWGGPGYVLPAEPATTADGAGFVAGGVGMADAGRDSAGSQWFVMHARAAHLDGRYTWIGSVKSGQKSADALLIGDSVVKATIVRH